MHFSYLIGLFSLFLSIQLVQVQTEVPLKKSESNESRSSSLLNSGSSLFTPQQSGPEAPDYMKADTLPATEVSWNEEQFDFGEIVQGDTVSHTFAFVNTGNHPLQLTRVKPSCGCTAPDWSKELIPPGKKGFVKVTFDSSGKSGMQNKSITVFLNTVERVKTLRFKGFITEEK